MTNPQTEARAIARFEYVHGSEGYALRPDAGGRYVLYTDYATALAAKGAELATLREADGNFWVAVARAERAEAELAATKVDRDDWINRCRASVMAFDEQKARAERAEARLAEARKALEPFAWIGQWLFARDLPDETPVVMVEGAGKPFALTRGMFKAAHTAARRALEAQGGRDG